MGVQAAWKLILTYLILGNWLARRILINALSPQFVLVSVRITQVVDIVIAIVFNWIVVWRLEFILRLVDLGLGWTAKIRHKTILPLKYGVTIQLQSVVMWYITLSIYLWLVLQADAEELLRAFWHLSEGADGFVLWVGSLSYGCSVQYCPFEALNLSIPLIHLLIQLTNEMGALRLVHGTVCVRPLYHWHLHWLARFIKLQLLVVTVLITNRRHREEPIEFVTLHFLDECCFT